MHHESMNHESIEHDFYKGHEDSDWQLFSDLAQSVEHWHDKQEVLGSISHCWQFLQNLFCSSLSALSGFCQDLVK